jgi:organic hydroperoxide reductase OsmC/OhrA
MTTKIQTVLMTGKTHTTASHREGAPRGDERVDIQMSTPGKAGNEIVLKVIQLHPTAEQLFAGAWSACYTGALGVAAKAKKVTLPSDM